jgi:hypothetical protein
MNLRDLQHVLWNVIRWDVQDKAWWSHCSAEVLYKAAQEVCVGIRTLALHCNDPEPNRDAQYYKEWIRDATNPTLDAIYKWNVPDGTMSKALPEFRKAADRISNCSLKQSEIKTDQPQVHPLESES